MKRINVGKHSVDVVKYQSGGVGFSNVMRCGSVWHCPVCACRISEERRLEIMDAITRYTGKVILITYTLSHNRFHSLNSVFEILNSARRWFKSGRQFQQVKQDYGWDGSIASVEITHGDNGWHPHAHEAVFLNDFDDTDLEALEKVLKARWLRSVDKHHGYADYEYGLDIRIADRDVYDYLAKFGRLPESADHDQRESWRVDHELAKANVKMGRNEGRTPFQLLEDYDKNDDKQAGALFREYGGVMKGKRQLTWSRGLRDLLGMNDEQDDQEIADDLEEINQGEILVTINLLQWRKITVNKWRGHVLKLARAGQIKRLKAWLNRLEQANE